ncbi:MAG: PEGA domain-containing protein [Polyangia bacterium]
MASTLGHGAAEKERPRSRRWLGVLLVGALGALSVVGGLARFKRQPAAHAPAAPTLQAPPAAPRWITTRIESEPPGAQVIRTADGQVLGRTPWQQQGEAQPGKLDLMLRLPGYRDQPLALSASADEQARVTRVAASPARTKKPTRGAVQQPTAAHAPSRLKRFVDKLTGKSTGKPVPIGTSQRDRESRR